MDVRGPNAYELRLAMRAGMRLVRRRYGYWAVVRPADDDALFVFRSSDAGWTDYRKFMADGLESGFLFS